MSGVGASDPAELLRRLRTRGRAGTAGPTVGAPAAPTGSPGESNPGGSAAAAAEAPGTPAGPGAAAKAVALLRATQDAAEALAAPDPDLARERAETAAGLRAEAPDPARAGSVEVMPSGTRLHHCRICGRLAAWGFDVALDRGRDGTWLCFEHHGGAG